MGRSIDEDSSPIPPPPPQSNAGDGTEMLLSSTSVFGEMVAPPTMASPPPYYSNAVEVWDWRRPNGYQPPPPPPPPPSPRRRRWKHKKHSKKRRRPGMARRLPPGRIPLDNTRRSLQVGIGAQVGMDVDYEDLYDRIFLGGGGRNKGNRGNGGGYGQNNNQVYGGKTRKVSGFLSSGFLTRS